jgi:hypothetical protein
VVLKSFRGLLFLHPAVWVQVYMGTVAVNKETDVTHLFGSMKESFCNLIGGYSSIKYTAFRMRSSYGSEVCCSLLR